MSKLAPSLTDARCAALRALYEELSKAHDSVASFRAKLLALLPLASGTGLFAILNIDQARKTQHLLAIGIFGALVALALYMYELRGIQRCGILSARARTLEIELLGSEIKGAFAPTPGPRFALATNTWASRIVYPATISVWAYVAFCGVDPRWEPMRIPLSLVCFVVFLVAGGVMMQAKAERAHLPNPTPTAGRASRAADVERHDPVAPYED
jgi:hypothetical protein